MKTSVTANPNPRPSLRRLLLAALAGGLGVFGLASEAATSATQTAPGSTVAATAPTQEQPGT